MPEHLDKILFTKQISPAAKLLYIHMWNHADDKAHFYSTASIGNELAEKFKCHRSYVYRHMVELEEQGFIRRLKHSHVGYKIKLRK